MSLKEKPRTYCYQTDDDGLCVLSLLKSGEIISSRFRSLARTLHPPFGLEQFKPRVSKETHGAKEET